MAVYMGDLEKRMKIGVSVPRGRVLAGGREKSPDGPRLSDTAASLPDGAADTHFCHPIRVEHTNDRQPAWPARSKLHTAGRSTDGLKMQVLAAGSLLGFG